jgi:5-oxopent-3-ene-1,2,5-tricarboxylate decarboxylase / 2-hydroxyhepta-2,4-diene-1,7-dioate isomerase
MLTCERYFDIREVTVSTAAILPVRLPLRGTVYGVALNFAGARAAREATFTVPPYGAPPQAPVLYIKPRNTRIAHGEAVPLPVDAVEVEVGATLGIVIGRDARRVPRNEAREFIAGYTLVNDVTLPHESIFRPPLRFNCRDGFCPIGPWVVPRDSLAGVDSLAIRAYVNDELRMQDSMTNLYRPIDVLIADISDFMTLRTGDILMVGVPGGSVRARAGDLMAVEIEGLGRLENLLVPEAELLAQVAS